MIRKEKLSQAKKLADLWCQQQKINIHCTTKRAQKDCMIKNDYAAKQLVAYKIILEIVTQKRGFVSES
ncbi:MULTISPECIES: hypothetical protein [Enterococcus]|uniref:hypothetical protein n=1 Tax=Enterococcus TaxID=1350 RepID=UPI00116468A7|nr:hypothetical protein [Enterococcus avium]HAP3021767.1 hypothetical protein [Enterococcus faecalis]AYQ24139.1 hypothetical protein AUF16_05710 [Enterococcus avium]HBI1562659.1 hypothetical protein [Enterococcus faecalis]HBI1565799.1 hypothetical protein [Enterococcus faecalis]HBI1718070.1 hypothetical protein [Enterococcus faecalis]